MVVLRSGAFRQEMAMAHGLANAEANLIRQYFEDVSESQPLSREHERELAQLIEAGRARAMNLWWPTSDLLSAWP